MDIASLVDIKKNPKIPDIAPGDTVRVSARIVEAGKERIQVFQGVVIRLRRGGAGASFTVRHISHGVGVERTFPLYSPRIEKVEIVRHGKVRRAKLYYLRGRSGKSARLKESRVRRKRKRVEEPVPEEQPEEPAAELEAEPVEETQPAEPAEEPAAELEAEPAPEQETAGAEEEPAPVPEEAAEEPVREEKPTDVPEQQKQAD